MMSEQQNEKWEIVLVRPRGRRLGVVEAPDQVTAISKAVELFDIDANQRNRIKAQRTQIEPC